MKHAQGRKSESWLDTVRRLAGRPQAASAKRFDRTVKALANSMPHLVMDCDGPVVSFRKMADDMEARQPGCQCHLEIGDSPCPVHGEDEEGGTG